MAELAKELVACVPVAALCQLEDVTESFYYAEARRGKAPKSERGHVPLAAAKAWLEKRAARRSERIEALRQQLRKLETLSDTGVQGARE